MAGFAALPWLVGVGGGGDRAQTVNALALAGAMARAGVVDRAEAVARAIP